MPGAPRPATGARSESSGCIWRCRCCPASSWPGTAWPVACRITCDGAELAPGRLEIEVSEELLLADADAGGMGVAALKEVGARIALDGFGRGSMSLRGLQLGVLDTLKLAREIHQHVPDDQRRGALVRALIALGKDLGLRVVAEGIDRHEQLALPAAERLRCGAGLHELPATARRRLHRLAAPGVGAARGAARRSRLRDRSPRQAGTSGIPRRCRRTPGSLVVYSRSRRP